MTEAEIAITKTTDRDGRVLAVKGWVSINAGDEYIPDYIRGRTSLSVGEAGTWVNATWTQEGAGIAIVAERPPAGAGSEPAGLVQAIETALWLARDWCNQLSWTARQLAIIARHHPNLAGPTEQLLARIDRIEHDTVAAQRTGDAAQEAIDTHEADKHPVEERQF